MGIEEVSEMLAWRLILLVLSAWVLTCCLFVVGMCALEPGYVTKWHRRSSRLIATLAIACSLAGLVSILIDCKYLRSIQERDAQRSGDLAS